MQRPQPDPQRLAGRDYAVKDRVHDRVLRPGRAEPCQELGIPGQLAEMVLGESGHRRLGHHPAIHAKPRSGELPGEHLEDWLKWVVPNPGTDGVDQGAVAEVVMLAHQRFPATLLPSLERTHP